MKIGYFLSCEEFAPRELVAQAKAAEAAGFHRRGDFLDPAAERISIHQSFRYLEESSTLRTARRLVRRA